MIRAWDSESDQPLRFGSFIEETGLEATDVLLKKIWSEWKAEAFRESPPDDANISEGRKALSRAALRADPVLLQAVSKMPHRQAGTGFDNARVGLALHYLLCGKKGSAIGVSSVAESMARWDSNPTLVSDAAEYVAVCGFGPCQ